jgi:hypothetical protein
LFTQVYADSCLCRLRPTNKNKLNPEIAINLASSSSRILSSRPQSCAKHRKSGGVPVASRTAEQLVGDAQGGSLPWFFCPNACGSSQMRIAFLKLLNSAVAAQRDVHRMHQLLWQFRDCQLFPLFVICTYIKL